MKGKTIKVAQSMVQQQDLYGPPPEDLYNSNNGNTNRYTTVEQPVLYGPPPDNPNNGVKEGSSIAIAIILFILGIIALVNKKMSVKAKIITISALVVIGVLLVLIINYLI